MGENGDDGRLDASIGDETDLIGDDSLSHVSTPSSGERVSRRGALLPGRTLGGTFTRALALGVMLGGAIGLVSGMVLVVAGGETPSGDAALHPLFGGTFGAVVGGFVGLVSGFGGAFGLLIGVWLGATSRPAKAVAGFAGAGLGVLVIGGIAARNGAQSPPIGALVVLVAGVVAAGSIAILDSGSRRAAAAAAARLEADGGAAGQHVDGAAVPVVPVAPAVRRGPPPVPSRLPSRMPSLASATVVPELANPERTRLLRQAQRFRSVAVVLGALSLTSPPWMLLIQASVPQMAYQNIWAGSVAWLIAQFIVAAAIPAFALGFAVASAVTIGAAQRIGTEPARDAQAPWGIAVLAGCTLALTLSAGIALLEAATDATEQAESSFGQQPASKPVAPLIAPDQPAQNEGEPATDPEVPSTLLSASEAEAGMQALLELAVGMAGPTATWTVAGTEAETERGVDGVPGITLVPPPVVETVPCLEGAGVSYSFPEVSFATGVITDTSTDEHDREITDRNVAASARIVAAWEALGYREDSGLGGNIDLWGAAELPAHTVNVRYSFGIVRLYGESHCVALR